MTNQADPKAVQLLKRGITSLNRKKYAEAKKIFKSIGDKFPQEVGVAERARVYFSICERQTRKAPAKSNATEDLYLTAVTMLNRGELDEAAEIFENLRRRKTPQGPLFYGLAAVQALKEDEEKALEYLTQAFKEDEFFKFVVRDDPDFITLRENENFQALIG